MNRERASRAWLVLVGLLFMSGLSVDDVFPDRRPPFDDAEPLCQTLGIFLF